MNYSAKPLHPRIEASEYLLQQLQTLQQDFRIGPRHLSAYLAVYSHWISSGCENRFELKAASIMHQAKISSSATWHRVIRDLAEYGYLLYYPSFNKTRSTTAAMP